MHAVVVRTGDRNAIDEGAEHVMANVLPPVRQAPGIVSAVWMTDGSSGTLNVLIFENEGAAQAALERVRNAPRPAYLKVDSVDVYRVLGHF